MSRLVSLALGGSSEAPGRPFAEPGVGPRYAPDRSCVVSALDIGLTIDPVAQTMVGDTIVEVVPLASGRLRVELDLGEVTVDRVTTADGDPLDWTHDGETLRVDGLSDQGGHVRVRYHGAPSRGLYFTGPAPHAPERRPMAWTQCQDEDGHHLFPCHDHPGRRCPVRLRITAPDGFDVVANGTLQGTEPGDEPDTTTWTWDQPEPIPAYLVVVVVGELDVLEDEAHNGTRGPLPLRYLVPKGADLDRARAVFARTPKMVEQFAGTFGVPFPWARYDQVVVHEFIFGGMENVCATVLTDAALTDERAALDRDADDLIAHELAHQWFGDLVTCADWSQAWLNEGWATYSEYLWQRPADGPDEADYALFGKLTAYLGEDRGRYQRSITQYRFRNPIDLFDRHLYQKGGLVLHTLRTVLGEEAFFVGVRAYLERHAFQGVHTRDFQRAMEEVSGRTLDGFFQQFVHGAGHPVLEVAVEQGDGLLTISVRQTQSGPGVAEAFHLPLPLRLVWTDSEDEQVQTVRLPLSQRERSWTLPVQRPPDRVEVDAGFSVLADVTLKAPRPLLLASLRDDPGVVGRIRAAQALGRDGSPEAVRALSQALAEEPFWGVRAEIARALAKRGGPQARAALIAALADEEHPKARRNVATSLGSFRHPDVCAALDAVAHDRGDPSLFVVAEAAKALGAVRAPTAVARLRELCEVESWNDVLRAAAVEGLGSTRDPAVLDDLVVHTAAVFPANVRSAAARALGRLAYEVDAVRLAAVNPLLDLAREAPFRVRLAAIGALGRAGDPRAVGVLRDIHQGDTDGRVARTAYEAGKQLASNDRSGLAAVSRMRDDLQELREENRALRARLDKIEARLSSPGPDAEEQAPNAQHGAP